MADRHVAKFCGREKADRAKGLDASAVPKVTRHAKQLPGGRELVKVIVQSCPNRDFLDPPRRLPLWSDDYNSLLPLLKKPSAEDP